MGERIYCYSMLLLKFLEELLDAAAMALLIFLTKPVVDWFNATTCLLPLPGMIAELFALWLRPFSFSGRFCCSLETEN